MTDELKSCPFCNGKLVEFIHERASCSNQQCELNSIGLRFETWNTRPDPVTEDYNERLHKAVMRFGAEFRDMEECRNFEIDITRIFAREPVTDDALREAIKEAQAEIQYCHDELKNVMSHEIGYAGMTYEQLQTLIIHTLKGQSK